ncbi:MAG: NAD(P)H-dependent oxidoreductase subunit E [Proteobacteria bacterium]|nr:NAD(P)H-dependent oxidoreductase subunit E [Pseudomonadota bacterium]
MSDIAPWNHTVAQAVIDALKDREGAALPILHALQECFGYIDEAAVPLVAEALNLSRAEVHGVLSFYHDFRRTPDPRRRIQLCRAEACQSLGCETLVQHAAVHHGVTPQGRGSVRLETVYCLGLCAQGPAALVDGAPVARLDAGRLSALINGAPVEAVLAGEEA